MIFSIATIHKMSTLSVNMTETLRVMELYFRVTTVDQTKFTISNHMETLKCVFSNNNESIVGAI
jgi:hypothetical protein